MVGSQGLLGKLDPSLVANSLLLGALANKQLKLNSNPGIRRDFLPATNLINALLLLVELREKGVFNLSAGKTTTLGGLVTVLAEEWRKQTGVSLPLVIESQGIEVPDFCFSPEKIVSLGLKMDLDLSRELGTLVASVLEGRH
jgi:nucleoside-diphosphate-sugar epimerase